MESTSVITTPEKTKSTSSDKQTLSDASEECSQSRFTGYRKGQFLDARESKKEGHKKAIKKRAEMQTEVYFKSPKITFHEFPISPFSIRPPLMNYFKLISYNGEPIKDLMVCSKCLKVFISSCICASNNYRHAERHMKREEKPLAALNESLIKAAKNARGPYKMIENILFPDIKFSI